MNAPSARISSPRGIWLSRLRSWMRLSLSEKIELLGLIPLALSAEVAVRTVGLSAITRRLGISLDADAPDRIPDPTLARGLSSDTIDSRAAAVDRLYRAWPRRDSCLRRALVLGFYIRSAHPTLRIGVAKEGDGVRAHAWIEVDGRVVGEQTGDFAPLRGSGVRPPSAAAQALRPHGR